METRVVVKEEALEKQIGGCMAGFLNIFDRPHLLSPKRLSASSPVLDSRNQKQQSFYSTPDDNLPLIVESQPWRFSKEAPRLSLDSRAVVDAKGSLKPRQIRRAEGSASASGSPSVIARLMGLEALPSAQPLQRCASESRVCREYRFVDSSNFQKSSSRSTGGEDPPAARAPPAPQRQVVHPKIFFDSADFFPQPKMSASTDDLETLKQLLEALRLKGLLHISSSTNQPQGNRNLVLDNHPSPIKPTKGRTRVSPTPNRRPALKQTSRTPEHVQINRGGPTIGDKQAEEEMWKVHDCNRQGRALLERCDKLLHSIAEMAAPGESQPSPVSVLDASLYHEDSSPSPVMKRCLGFPGTESEEDESWGDSMSSSSDSEYVYISDILRASDCLPQESDIFSLLEKQQYLKGKSASRAAAQERRLIFDAVQEIVGQRRRLPPWRMVVGEADKKMQVIWSEFQKTRKKMSSSSTEEEDLVGYVCGVLERDLSEDRWRDCQVEMSEAVLDIERLVFKDLIGETIRHMAALNRSDSLRRRLLF